MRIQRFLIASLLILTLGVSAVVRADLWWDSNGNSSGGSNTDTATGTWGVDNFWSSDLDGNAVTGAWIADETAVFSAGTNVTGTYDVTVSGTQSASGIRFEEGTLTLNGGTINLTNAATITIASGLTETINSVIGGSSGLTQSGEGTLVLGGANTYSGNTLLADNPNLFAFNILRLGASNVIPDTSIVQIEGQNTRFELNGQTETVRSIATINTGAGALANSAFDLGSGTLIISDGTGETSLVEGPIWTSAAGKIIKNGGGQLNLGATNSAWDGELQVNDGTVGFRFANSLGTNSSSTARLTLNGGAISNYNGNSVSLQTLNVDITNSFSAVIGSSNMELLGSAVSGEGTVAITLKVDNPTITVDNFAGSGTFIFRGPVGDEGQNRSFTKAGPGTLTLNNPNNSYGGDTTILDGEVRIDDNATLGDGTGTLHLSGGNLVTTNHRDPTLNPVPNPINLTADSAIATRRQLGDTIEVDFTSNSIGGSAGTLTFRNEATGTANPDNQFEPRFSGNGFNFSRPIVIEVTNPQRTTRFSSANATGTQTYSGPISGAGSFRRMTAGGTTVLSGANTYSGGTEVEAGTLSVSGASATLGTGDVTVTGGTLSIAGGVANAIANTATLSISGTGMVSLGTGINDMIAGLLLDGAMQASGTYGSSASSATFKLDQWFSGMGIVTVAAPGLAGDYNNDGKVDAADYVVWRKDPASFGGDPGGYNTWRANFGAMAGAGGGSALATAVPEPTSLGLLMLALTSAFIGSVRRSRRRK